MGRVVNRELVSVIATVSLAGMAMSVLQPVLALYLDSLGISPSSIGLMFSLAMVGMVFGESYGGWLADKIGIRIPLGIGTILCIPLVLCFVFLTSVPFIFGLFLVWGVVRAAVFGPGRGYIGVNVPAAEKATYLAIYAASMSVSRSIGTFIGGYIGEHLGYDWNFYFAAGIALLGGLMVIFALRKIPFINPALPAPITPASGGAVMKAPYRSRIFIAQCVIGALCWAAIGVNNFLPLFAVENIKIAETEIGLLFTISSLVGAALMIPMGRLSDRKNKKVMMITGLLITAVSMAGVALATQYGVLIAAVVLQSVGGAVFGPAAVSLLSDTVPRHWQSTAMGIYGGCEDIGVVIGSALGGFIYEALGAQSAFLLIGTIAPILGTIVVLTMMKKKPSEALK